MQHRSPRALPWAECGNWAYSPPHLCSQRSEIMHLYEPFTKNGKALKILIWQSELPNWRMRLRIRSLKRTTKLIWQFRLPICKAKMKSVCCNWRFRQISCEADFCILHRRGKCFFISPFRLYFFFFVGRVSLLLLICRFATCENPK